MKTFQDHQTFFSSLNLFRVSAHAESGLYIKVHTTLSGNKKGFIQLYLHIFSSIYQKRYIWMCEIRGRSFLKFEIEKIFSICVTTGNTSFPYVLGGTPG